MGRDRKYCPLLHGTFGYFIGTKKALEMLIDIFISISINYGFLL